MKTPEIQRDAKGDITEIKTSTMHLEQMDEGHWWMLVTDCDGNSVVINFKTPKPRSGMHSIRVEVEQ